MAQQKIALLSDNGAKEMRVLEAVTPLNTALAPAVNAKFLGQIHIDTAAGDAYIAIAVGSETATDDWKKITATAIV